MVQYKLYTTEAIQCCKKAKGASLSTAVWTILYGHTCLNWKLLYKKLFSLTSKFFSFLSSALFFGKKSDDYDLVFFYFYTRFYHKENVELFQLFMVFFKLSDNFCLMIFRMSKIQNLLSCETFHHLDYIMRIYNEVGDESFDSGTAKNL